MLLKARSRLKFLKNQLAHCTELQVNGPSLLGAGWKCYASLWCSAWTPTFARCSLKCNFPWETCGKFAKASFLRDDKPEPKTQCFHEEVTGLE